ncbi:MAG: amidase, partial [Jatrophihabitans sp.]|uniref:amidase n=1 Tax=Jatrophihabitans sp. TaxID=1932789 RepID=UPI003F804D0E
PSRSGSAATPATPRTADHPVVHRLRAAGALVVGITRMPELAVFGSTDGAFGISRNPWNTSRTPGGSSGGSAAAVAAGMVPAAHANDGMGSIRIPAACCGLVGIKPGFGVVPSEIGEGSWFDMAENGPVATTVADAALFLSVIADDASLATPEVPDTLRIAVSTRVPMPVTPLDANFKAVTRATGDLLRGAGHAVTAVKAPYPATLGAREIARWTAGTALDARAVRDPAGLEPRVRRHAAVGSLVMRAGLPKEAGRTKWRARAEQFFAKHDVLVTPALAQKPKRADRWSERGWLANLLSDARYAPFAAPWNLAGWPAMVVPAGQTPDGTPLAVQLVARPGWERQLLGLAAQLEQLRPWRRVAPLG